MQFKMEFARRSEDEEIKDRGLILDLDEIARRGTMSGSEKVIAKWYGVYAARHAGNHMARIIVPGGVLTASQIRKICETSERYGQGLVSITTRQAVQLHWLKLKAIPDLLRDLLEDSLSTYHGCGDVARNVAECPLAETCRYRRINVRPHALRTHDVLVKSADLENLPRKFKVTFSGCSAGCAQPYMNCVGLVAVRRAIDGMQHSGFRVVIGGGMGWKAFVGQELWSFVPEESISQVVRAIGLLFRDHGDRYNRQKSRLKFVVARQGIDRCRDLVLEYLESEGVRTNGFSTEPFEDVGVEVPDRPLTEQDPIGTDGNATVRIMVPKGELTFRQMAKIAELSEVYGDQRLYTTNRQNLELHGVAPHRVEELKKEIREVGFSTNQLNCLQDVVACVGTTYCPKAVARTRDLYDLLDEVFAKPKYAAIQTKGIVNITGCPNSCAPHRVSDLGFSGVRIREKLGSVEGFEMLIGGTELQHGLRLGEFKTRDIPEIVELVLDTFMDIRQEHETLAQCVQRVGVEPFERKVFS